MPNNLPKSYLDTGLLRSRLKLKSVGSERKLLESHSSAAKFFEKYKLRPGQIRQHAANLLASGALASSLFLTAQSATPVNSQVGVTDRTVSITVPQQLHQQLSEMLATVLPKQVQPLTEDEEEKISNFLEKTYGLKAKAKLEGNKLNDGYGRMGAEQHLPRWPGDTAEAHETLVDKGITPGLGGWGYVGDPVVEKYYVAVQTLYLPNWNTDTKKLAEWYKHRRVVVVNPANGKVIVAAVADAGPANWTGKKFGGSPEVMEYLGINYGMQNHPVILFFLDDPQNQIPLGPVEYNVVTENPGLANKA